MKPDPAPKVPGKTPWKRLDNAVRAVFSVLKDDLSKEEAKLNRKAENKKSPRKRVTA